MTCFRIHIIEIFVADFLVDLSGGMEEESLSGIETWSLHFCTFQCDASNVIHGFFGESRVEKTTFFSFGRSVESFRRNVWHRETDDGVYTYIYIHRIIEIISPFYRLTVMRLWKYAQMITDIEFARIFRQSVKGYIFLSRGPGPCVFLSRWWCTSSFKVL